MHKTFTGAIPHALLFKVIMIKTLVLLLLILCWEARADVHAQHLTLSHRHTELGDVLQDVREQSGYSVFYDANYLKMARPVTVELADATLEQSLAAIFADQPFTYSIENRVIVIRSKPTARTRSVNNMPPEAPVREGSNLVLAYPIVTGRVTDSLGRPLAGASVRVLNAEGKRTTLQTKTGHEGYFELKNVPEDAQLEITYIGYVSQIVGVRPHQGTIILAISSSSILEVEVNAGYYTVKDRLRTGNIGSISSKDIERQPVTNPLATLHGRVPGLVITQSSGVPGSSFRVELRGRTAIDREITDDQPLFVIDGVPAAQNNGYLNQYTSALGYPTNSTTATIPGGLSPLNSLNPQDIERIEVLKDADATAIYGSRGANGVILITTKKGSGGRTDVFVNMSTGWSRASRTVDMMNTQQYLAMRREAFANDNVTMTPDNSFDLLVWDTTRYTDFKKLLIGGTAHTSSIQAGISGGNSLTQFRVSGAYQGETTVFPGDWVAKRLTTDANIQHRSRDERLHMALAVNYGSSNSDLPTDDYASAINITPNMQLWNEDGELSWEEGGYSYYSNPLAGLKSVYTVETDNLNANLQLRYRVFPGVDLRSSFGYNTIRTDEHKTYAIGSQNPAYEREGSAYFASNRFNSWIWEPQADYRKVLGAHDIQLLVGGSIQQQESYASSISGSGYSNDLLLNSLAGAAVVSATNGSSAYKYAAIYGRVSYNLEDTYLLTLSGRRDGSSRFGPGKQYANFGAVGVAWIFTQERLLQEKLPWLSFGKVRGSYGTTGNDKIANYQYLDTYETVLNTSYQDSMTVRPYKLFNPDYRWESTRKLEVAMDLGFFADRILLSTAWFRNVSSNQLINYKLALTTGFGSVVSNFPAKVANSGLEVSLVADVIRHESWEWTMSANITVPRNQLLSFPDLDNSSYYLSYREGHPLNLIYLYRYLGVDPENGYYHAEDLNGDGRLTSREDRQVLGHLDPTYYGGIQNTFSYKSWELTFFFDYRKQLGTGWLAWQFSRPGGLANMPVTVMDRWQQPGDVTSVMRYTQRTSDGLSSLYLRDLANTASGSKYEDASFFRLKNATIAYTVSDDILKRIGARSTRFYLQTQNMFTISGYKGAHPEVQSLRRLSPMRTLVVGAQINF